jgi:transposase-like protein
MPNDVVRYTRYRFPTTIIKTAMSFDILLRPRRDHAAARFFRKLLERSGRVPRRLVTDRLWSHRAAQRIIMPSVVHDTTRYANKRFLAVHDVVRNLFTSGRHRH